MVLTVSSRSSAKDVGSVGDHPVTIGIPDSVAATANLVGSLEVEANKLPVTASLPPWRMTDRQMVRYNVVPVTESLVSKWRLQNPSKKASWCSSCHTSFHIDDLYVRTGESTCPAKPRNGPTYRLQLSDSVIDKYAAPVDEVFRTRPTRSALGTS